MATKATMIKLTLTPHTRPITYIFEKNTVTIGSLATPGSLPDLVLPQGDVEPIHIKIITSGNKFIAFNVAEDPFTAINGFPFAKRVLHQGDLLQIGSTLLQFEGFFQNIQNEEDVQYDDNLLFQMLDDKMQMADNSPSLSLDETFDVDPFNLEDALRDLDSWEMDDFKDGEVSCSSVPILSNLSNERKELDLIQDSGQSQVADDELDDLLLRVEALDNFVLTREDQFSNEESQETDAVDEMATEEDEKGSIPEKIPKIESQSLAGTEPKHLLDPQEEEDEVQEIISAPLSIARRKSMKDDYPNDEETPPKKENAFSQGSLIFSVTWKELVLGFAAFSLLIAIVLGCLYVAITGYNEEEEIKAAQAVADVAMALNFAQINHAEPQNQNWSDPDFLKHNLNAVLASEYPPLANVDSQGHFYKTSYILRIYTGADLNHFLVIAQPIPGLLQWFMPKAAITVDSSLMVLRKISDLKTLNRLLVNVTLDTSNSTDIANFVTLGELLPLTELKKYHPHTGFDLPKALGLIRPGAENLIYNGVRYYPFGESLMKKAIALYKSDDTGQDLLPLIDEISRFTQFPNIVLYSSEGLRMAQRGQKALATFFPRYKFIHAYLLFNAQHLPYNSHLLIDDSSEELVATASDEEAYLQNTKDQIDHSPLDSPNKFEEEGDLPHETKEAELDKGYLLMTSRREIDQNHPLYYKLMVLRHAREHSLMVLSEEMDHENTQGKLKNPNAENSHKDRYQTIIDNLQEKIIRAISALQQEYATMPFKQFMNYVEASGLETLVEENYHNYPESSESMLQFENSFQNQLLKIQQSNSLKKLNICLKNLLQILTLGNVPDPKIFILYQNLIRTAVLNRLDTLIFSSIAPLPTTDLTAENSTILSHILKAAWVIDEGEMDYYLDEFHQLLGP